MSERVFRSQQAATLKAFIEVQRLRGYSYKHESYLLQRFDRYLYECGYRCLWLEQAVIDAYTARFGSATECSQLNMLSALRGYSRFLHLRYPHSCVLRVPAKRPKCSSRFYIYSPGELSAIMGAAATLGPKGSIRPHTVSTLIGLLYVSGLRISEALGLNVEDLDVNERTLLVRKGKFGKDRYVPLTSSTVQALLRYRQKAERVSKDEALFISSKGRRVACVTIGNLFRRLLAACHIASCKPWPRLHDLRHTYAVNCLCRWYESGENVNALLPVLSTVMGHVTVSCTQIYLHVPAQLLEMTASRFYHRTGSKVIPEKRS